MLEFISANLPILICFLGGMVLLITEAFLPGFGVFGISGIVIEIAAVALTWLQYGPAVAVGLLAVILSMITLGVSLSLRSAAKGRISKSKLILNDRETVNSSDTAALTGRTGKALTALRPAGTADFDGVRLDVVTAGEFIEKGCEIRIIRTEGSRIIVTEVPKDHN